MTVGCMDFGSAFNPNLGFLSRFNVWERSRTFRCTAVEVEPAVTPLSPTMTTTVTAEEIRPVLPAFKHDVTGEADPLATLTALAEARNGSAFAHAVAAMAWDAFTPGEIAQAVRLALAAGAFSPARYISAEGHRLYPEDAELANMARILAPPKVLGTRPANPSAGRDLEWLRQHASEYRGQWLALKDGQFLAAASTARELQAALPRIQGIFVTRVA